MSKYRIACFVVMRSRSGTYSRAFCSNSTSPRTSKYTRPSIVLWGAITGEGRAAFAWPDAALKARKAGDALAWRLQHVHGFEEFKIEYIGAGALSPVRGRDVPCI